eukprot:5108439-Ditylum_brightwellii.AAC.1
MKRMTKQIAVTAPHSREQQDALASSSSAGEKEKNGDKKYLNKRRRHGRQQWQYSKMLKALFFWFRLKKKDVYKDEDIPVLTVPQLKKLCMLKYGKGPSSGTNKPEPVSSWMRKKYSQPMHDFSWTAADDETLKSLNMNEIKLKTTVKYWAF